jgi:hypothetical protein
MTVFKELQKQTAPTYVFEIFMGGDFNDCKRELVQIAAEQGACWSVEPTEFIYSGGREQGFVVRTINYPRFPKTVDTLESDAIYVATRLLEKLGQGSCSIVGPINTVWLTRRKEDK